MESRDIELEADVARDLTRETMIHGNKRWFMSQGQSECVCVLS
jgi:hypothetical protein